MSEKLDCVIVKCENEGYLRRAENFRLFLMIALSVVIYAFIYFQVTTIIEKSKEMDRIAEIVPTFRDSANLKNTSSYVKTADLTRRMNRLSELDYNMSVTLEKLRESYTRRMAIIREAEQNCFPTE